VVSIGKQLSHTLQYGHFWFTRATVISIASGEPWPWAGLFFLGIHR